MSAMHMADVIVVVVDNDYVDNACRHHDSAYTVSSRLYTVMYMNLEPKWLRYVLTHMIYDLALYDNTNRIRASPRNQR